LRGELALFAYCRKVQHEGEAIVRITGLIFFFAFAANTAFCACHTDSRNELLRTGEIYQVAEKIAGENTSLVGANRYALGPLTQYLSEEERGVPAEVTVSVPVVYFTEDAKGNQKALSLGKIDIQVRDCTYKYSVTPPKIYIRAP